MSRLKVVLEGDAASLPRRARLETDDIMTLFDSKFISSRLNRTFRFMTVHLKKANFDQNWVI